MSMSTSTSAAFSASMAAAAATTTNTHYSFFGNRKTLCTSVARFLIRPYTAPRLGTSEDVILWGSRATIRCRPTTTTTASPVCLVVSSDKGGANKKGFVEVAEAPSTPETQISVSRVEQTMARKKEERRTNLLAAVLSSFGFTSMAVAAVYSRFAFLTEGGEVPVLEAVATFTLAVVATVGMEFWSRWVHRALWHGSLWHMHKSHHKPREGPFELNDVFVILNAAPATGLLWLGFHNSGLVPGLCYGAGLGITLYGTVNMFLHDGLMHQRFPVGPFANVPYLRRVAVAHQIHHSNKFKGVPYGIFLGPMELEDVGGNVVLEKEIQRIIKDGSGEASSSEDVAQTDHARTKIIVQGGEAPMGCCDQ